MSSTTLIRGGCLLVSILSLACRGERRSSEAERPAPSAARAAAPTADAAAAPMADATAAVAAAAPVAPVRMSCQVGGPVLAVAPGGGDGIDCFALREGAAHDAFKAALDDDADDDPVALCPQVYAVRGDQATHLKADGGPLTQTSDCCNITRLAGAGPAQLVVRGEGSDCFGGRAEAELDATYVVHAGGLQLVDRPARPPATIALPAAVPTLQGLTAVAVGQPGFKGTEPDCCLACEQLVPGLRRLEALTPSLRGQVGAAPLRAAAELLHGTNWAELTEADMPAYATLIKRLGELGDAFADTATALDADDGTAAARAKALGAAVKKLRAAAKTVGEESAYYCEND